MGELTEIRDRLRSREDHHPDCSIRNGGDCDCYASRDCRTHAALDNIGAELDRLLAALAGMYDWQASEVNELLPDALSAEVKAMLGDEVISAIIYSPPHIETAKAFARAAAGKELAAACRVVMEYLTISERCGLRAALAAWDKLEGR